MRRRFVGALSRSDAKSGISPRYQNISDTRKYVDTAAASHGSALLTCGQVSIIDGYGNSQYPNHGRPRWRNGNVPAWMTANSVIASASRLIDVRQPCSNR